MRGRAVEITRRDSRAQTSAQNRGAYRAAGRIASIWIVKICGWDHGVDLKNEMTNFTHCQWAEATVNGAGELIAGANRSVGATIDFPSPRDLRPLPGVK